MTTSICPSETSLVAYADGRASPEERTAIEAHMTACADCRMIVSMLARGDGRSTTDPLAKTVAVDGEVQAAELTPGEMFEDKYRIERVIGAGGMGVVAEATHTGLGRRVAIKFMRRESKSAPEGAVRFLREARTCANLSSDHVVRVFDNGMSAAGEPYLVMELLRGEDLADLLRRDKKVEPAQAARWVLEACDAIGEAHDLGVVHRDLKPANLFLADGKSGEKKIKVLDFGISKLVGEGSFGGLTSKSALLGSPRYMSPEQTQSSARADSRTDIWALGVVLFELVTGSTPFDAENAVGLAAAILTQKAPLLRERCPDAPAALEKIVTRCLEKNPDERFPSIAALAQALSPLAQDGGARKKKSSMLPLTAALVATVSLVAIAMYFRSTRVESVVPATIVENSSTPPTTSAIATQFALPPASASASVSAVSAAPSTLSASASSTSFASSSSTSFASSSSTSTNAPKGSSSPKTRAPSSSGGSQIQRNSASSSVPEDLPGMSDRK